MEEYQEQMRGWGAGGKGAWRERRRLYGVWDREIGRREGEECGEEVVEEAGEGSGGEYVEVTEEQG